MRTLLVVLVVCLAATAWAGTYNVPDEDLGITQINQAMEMASAGDTVLVSAGVYDSVRTYTTPLGVRRAVVSMKDGVTLMGRDRDDVKVDQTGAEYGILCLNVGPGTVIENLTIRGGIRRRWSEGEDGDGRGLIAGIACVDGASPTITDVTIEGVSTGVVVRSQETPSAPVLSGMEIARCDHHGIYVYRNGASPVIVSNTTIVENFDSGMYVFDGAADVSNTNITHNGSNGIRVYLSSPTVRYCNVYWNDEGGTPPENYGGMTDVTGTDGNVSLEPYYCDFTGAAGFDYHVCVASDILTLGEGGTYIGAWGAGCTNCESPVEFTSWGSIKAMYK